MPSSVMKLASSASLLLAAGRLAAASTYTLEDSYTTSNFFDEFDFYTGADPTSGFVDYQSDSAASSSGLAGYSNGAVYLGADHTTKNPANGRASTRVSSKKSYTHMLLVADLSHMPVGCGTWPALWSFGPNWPSSGEIDLLEGVNSQSSNEITLHTAEGCKMTKGSSLAGTKMIDSTDCGADNGNTGCPQTTTSSNNYGTGLNSAGGGIYAMEWTSEKISIWWFERNGTMANKLSATSGGAQSVDTSAFGDPTASFVGGSGCDIDSYFKNHNIIIDTTFCGDWAGQTSVWESDSTCSALASTCQDYVANNPDAFVDAYWLFNYINVYTTSGSSGSATTTSSGASPSATTGTGGYRRSFRA